MVMVVLDLIVHYWWDCVIVAYTVLERLWEYCIRCRTFSQLNQEQTYCGSWHLSNRRQMSSR